MHFSTQHYIILACWLH